MKISKLLAIALQSKIRFAFLVVALFYNFILGFYLKTFLVLSQTLTVFYLLSVLSGLVFYIEIKTEAIRIAVYISLINGQATLWDTNTVELADEICADCDTDEEKVNMIYNWVINNFKYDYDCNPVVQYFNIRKNLRTHKGICYDFTHMFTVFCSSQNIHCYVVDGDKRDNI